MNLLLGSEPGQRVDVFHLIYYNNLTSSGHDLGFLITLLISNQLKKLNQVLFEALEDSVGIFGGRMVLVKTVHALGQADIWEHPS